MCGAGATVSSAEIFKVHATPNSLTDLRLQQKIASESRVEYHLGDWPKTAKNGSVLNASGWPAASCTARFQNIWGRVNPPRDVAW